MVKEHSYQVGTTKEKEKEFGDNYMKSFIHRSNFNTKTLQKFKLRVKDLNSNIKNTKTKDRATIKAEKVKHDQNKRASQKRGLPRFDQEMAKRLLDGKFHEMEDEEEDEVQGKGAFDAGKTINARDKSDMQHQNKLE